MPDLKVIVASTRPVAIPLRDHVEGRVLHPAGWMADAAEAMLEELSRQTGALRLLREGGSEAALAPAAG